MAKYINEPKRAFIILFQQSQDTGQCQASARWVEQHALIHTAQGKFLANIIAAEETCAAASNDKKACENARICEYTFDQEGKGTCGVTPTWVRGKRE